MSRSHAPALDLTWTTPPDEEALGRLYATIDDLAATAIEDRRDGIRVFFVDGGARDAALAVVQAAHSWLTCAAVDVPHDDWAARSQAALGPVTVGRFVVAPPASGLAPDARTIIIQPSMGFGTGHHASTRLCLALLQEIDVTGTSVVDVGTGSGILAVAAWRLGAADVVAIDRDPDALEAARDSIDRNGASAHVTLRRADLTAALASEPGRTFDVILANLTGATLIQHAAAIRRLAAPGAHLIVSGILADEEATVVQAMLHSGWTAITGRSEAEWKGILLEAHTERMGQWVNG